MAKVLIYCQSIQWDSEGESLKECNLPNSCVVEVDQEELKKVESNQEEIHALVCRTLDEKYGFQVYECRYRALNVSKSEALGQLLFFLYSIVAQADFADTLLVLEQVYNDSLKAERAVV